MRDHVAFVLSFGGHGDLPRTLRYLCTGEMPGGGIRPPHDYGIAIILLGVADQMVPPEQVRPLRQAILAFLHASHVDMFDKAEAQTEFARAQNACGRSARAGADADELRQHARRRAPRVRCCCRTLSNLATTWRCRPSREPRRQFPSTCCTARMTT